MVGVFAGHNVVSGLDSCRNVLNVVGAEAIVVLDALLAIRLLSGRFSVVVPRHVLLARLQVGVSQVTIEKR